MEPRSPGWRHDAPLAPCVVAILLVAGIVAPGWIGRHGVSMLLLLGAMLALVGPAGEGRGFAAGLFAAASLMGGVAGAPPLAPLGMTAIGTMVIGTMAIGEWVTTADHRRLRGLGIGALTGLAIGRGLFASATWNLPVCDGFTAIAWQAGLPLAAAALLLSVLPALTARSRLAVAIGVSIAAAGTALWLSPSCFDRGGQVGSTAWLGYPAVVAVALAATRRRRFLGSC